MLWEKHGTIKCAAMLEEWMINGEDSMIGHADETLLWRNCTLREQDPKHTVTEYIVTHVHINFYSHSNS